MKKLDRWVAAENKADATATLLQSLPGVGVFFAAVLASEIDTIERFYAPTKLCAYAGLAPTNTPGFFIVKLGFAGIELFNLIGTANQVVLDGNGSPEFKVVVSSAMSAYLARPMTDSLYLRSREILILTTNAPIRGT